MSEEDAARAFERFWRADPSRARESGGAGLGLAIVSAITEAHGGTAEVVTAPGEGATFRIRIPREGAFSPPAPAPALDDQAADADHAYKLLPEVQPEA
jgi:two-component system OmpR family sensor kinase